MDLSVCKQQLLDQATKISPLSPALMTLLEAIDQEGSDVTRLKQVIESDANLSALILKIANSPLYRLSRQIDSITNACVLLGYDQLRNIIYACAFEQINEASHQSSLSEALRRHALASAVIASELIKSPVGYALGLLHDLGKQIALYQAPHVFDFFLNAPDESTRAGCIDLFRELGSTLAERWHLPPLFSDCIRNYIDPSEAQEQNAALVAQIALAHCLAGEFGYPSPGEPERPIPCVPAATDKQTLELAAIQDKIQETIGLAVELAS